MNNNLFKTEVVLGIIFILVFASVGMSLINSIETEKIEIDLKKMRKEIFSDNNFFSNYNHNVFVGIGTSQNCKPCHSWNEIIHETYISGLYDFDYVEMIEFDHDGKILNEKVNEWSKYYDIGTAPTSIFDGDFIRITGNYSEELHDALNLSGNRVVADINANMTLTWLDDAKIQVNILIVNDEETLYEGYLRAFITEIESRYDTYYGDPYHFGFLDYAYDNNITISPGDTYVWSVIWDGNEHEDKHGDDFGDIIQSNIQITLVVYNENNGYVDESISARMTSNSPPSIPFDPFPQDEAKEVDIEIELTWKGGDPDGDNVVYDVYFGDSYPPQKVISNQSSKSYNPGILEYDTNYFWRIIAWDEHGLKSEGDIWTFTTIHFEDLEVNLLLPEENSFYFRNFKLFSLPRITFIYGPIKLIVNATSSVGIVKVEFYINDELKETVNDYPYEYKWSPIFCSKYTLKIIGYDNDGNQDEDEITIFKWRAHPVIITFSLLLIAGLILK